MYGIEPMFWTKLFLVLGMLILSIYGFNAVMRRYLNVEKPNFFSYNHVNEKHKNIDWTIRNSFIIILIISSFFVRGNSDGTLWYLEMRFLMPVFLVTIEVVRAYMEWKYAENPNQYILTISQLVVILILIWIFITPNFLNLF